MLDLIYGTTPGGYGETLLLKWLGKEVTLLLEDGADMEARLLEVNRIGIIVYPDGLPFA